MLSLAHRADGWQPPIVKTVATENKGINELVDSIEECWKFFQHSTLRAQKKRDGARQRLLTLLEERLVHAALQEVFPNGEINQVVDRIAERQEDPYSIVDKIVRDTQFRRLK
jgi:LAO/AO transport system kinase